MKLRFLLASIVLGLGCQPAPAGSRAPDAEEAAPEKQLALTVSAEDPTRGPAMAPVTVIVFGDYACMHCRRANGFLQKLLEENKDGGFRVVWKHLPMNDEDAVSAAVLAHGVRELGGDAAFWTFHDSVYADELIGQSMHARVALGLQKARTLIDADTRAIAEASQEFGVDRVRSSVEMGSALGINALPTLFINGRRMVGAKDLETIRAAIAEERAAVAPLLATGMSMPDANVARMRVAAENDALLWGSPAAPSDGDAEVAAEEELPRATESVFKVAIDGSPTLGPSDAPVTIVAFSDFQCPHCRDAQTTLRSLQQAYPGKLRFVFKHNPLPSHDDGLKASLFAAFVQRKLGEKAFFLAHDELFARELSEQTFFDIARKLGLDPNEAVAAVAERRELATVEADLLAADEVGARSTPTFFINGRALVGAVPEAAFRAAIDEELKHAEQLRATGVAASDLYANIIREGFVAPLPPRVKAPSIGKAAAARGPTDAPLVVHIFADFECHYCRVHAKTLTRLEQEFKGKLQVVFHPHPLRGARARRASLAGLEALKQKGQSGFWKFSDKLFSLEGALTDDVIAQAFTDSGLDASKLAAAFENESYGAQLDEEIALAEGLGLTGTPMSLVNGYRVSGAVPYVRLRKLANLALAESGKQASP